MQDPQDGSMQRAAATALLTAVAIVAAIGWWSQDRAQRRLTHRVQAAAALADELWTHGRGADEAGWHARLRALQVTLEGPNAGEATYEAALRACRSALAMTSAEGAQATCRDALTHARAATGRGAWRAQAQALGYLSEAALHRGDVDEARAQATEALRLARICATLLPVGRVDRQVLAATLGRWALASAQDEPDSRPGHIHHAAREGTSLAFGLARDEPNDLNLARGLALAAMRDVRVDRAVPETRGCVVYRETLAEYHVETLRRWASRRAGGPSLLLLGQALALVEPTAATRSEAVAVLTAASRLHPYAPRVREALAHAAGDRADAALREHAWGRAELAIEAEVEAATRWRALEPESGSAMEALARAQQRRQRLAKAVGTSK